ncbi:MAG: HAD family phosphatase [Atribacterota bacterium]|nr:HAD family phosphatase [Atribacterota bacterium]MDD4895536.1 HAD family phosphatase [Atribacterota bacterium]MDD5637167.1 HAD family phosphatase [Atribacterota bacterium]
MLFIFDMGGVVANHTNVIPSIAEHLEINEKQFFELAGQNWINLLCGKISSQQFWKQFSEEIKQNIKTDLFKKYFYPTINQGVTSIIRELRKNYRVVCGTNTFQVHYQFHLERGDYCYFDNIYASHLLGIAKPDPKFYRYIIDKEDATVDRTIFIDDTLENVIVAQRMGIKAILFVDNYSLKNELLKYTNINNHE